jgi:hypothetical protein
VVLARSQLPVSCLDPEAELQRFRKLPRGTAVVVRDGSTRSKGSFIGCEVRDGKEGVAINRGSYKHWLPLEQCSRVEVVSDEVQGQPVTGHGRRIVARRGFLEVILGRVDPLEFSVHSRLECVLLGRLNFLRSEICGFDLAVPSDADRKFEKGALQDVLKVRRFAGSLQSFRTSVLPADRPAPAWVADRETPAVAIFDGALGFLKGRDRWRRAAWVVVLDRTEARFDEAVEILNLDYTRDHVDDTAAAEVEPPPPGVEVMWYRETPR